MRSSDIDLQIDPTPTPPNPIPGTEVHLTPGLYPEGTDGSTFNIEYSDPQHVQIIDAVDFVRHIAWDI